MTNAEHPQHDPSRRRWQLGALVLGAAVLVVGFWVASTLGLGKVGPPATVTPLAPGSTTSAQVTSAAPASPVLPPTPTAPPASTAASTAALGAWTPTCTSASADATALLANLLGQPQFTVRPVSGVAGFADAAKAAAKPLVGCPVAHSLAVKAGLAFESDAGVTPVVGAAIDAVLRTVTLTLSESKVGRFAFGSTGVDAARPVLTAVFGPPTVGQTGCELSGGSWTDLTWGGLTVSFDNNTAGKPVESWRLRLTPQTPTNLEIAGGLPKSATLAQLQAVNPAAKQVSLFDTASAPWIVELKPGLTYLWSDSASGPSDQLVGGPLHLCE